MVMDSVSVARLKSNLSQYLEIVRKGKEVIVTSRRHPIARLAPLEENFSGLEIIPATKPISSLRKVKGIKFRVDPVAFLLADRRRR